MTEYDRACQAADYIRGRVKAHTAALPAVAVVLGSGLHGLANELTDALRLPYKDIPHFPVSTVPYHAGELLVGRIGERSVFLFSGRFHYYEGYDMRETAFYVKVLHLLGVRTLLLSNAAGGVNEELCVGDLMLITDHIKLSAESPARGENDERLMPRFFDMSRVYSPRLQALICRQAEAAKLSLKKGTYFFMGGPQYETPAEVRMIRLLGGDAVGMSTVPEAIVAAGCGMEVAAISCITNAAAGVIPGATLSHEEVGATADKVGGRFRRLICDVLAALE